MYVTSRLEVARKAARSYDSDSSSPLKKREKKEEVDTDYMVRFYHFFPGKEVDANEMDLLQWIRRDEMHLTALH